MEEYNIKDLDQDELASLKSLEKIAGDMFTIETMVEWCEHEEKRMINKLIENVEGNDVILKAKISNMRKIHKFVVAFKHNQRLAVDKLSEFKD